jgi:hypothetical protein
LLCCLNQWRCWQVMCGRKNGIDRIKLSGPLDVVQKLTKIIAIIIRGVGLGVV